ncbi:unnamed protein product [Prunus brigantina]
MERISIPVQLGPPVSISASLHQFFSMATLRGIQHVTTNESKSDYCPPTNGSPS